MKNSAVRYTSCQVKEDLSVRPKVRVLSKPKKTIALSVQQNPPIKTPFKTHMDKLLEKADPVKEARKSKVLMDIVSKMRQREKQS